MAGVTLANNGRGENPSGAMISGDGHIDATLLSTSLRLIDARIDSQHQFIETIGMVRVRVKSVMESTELVLTIRYSRIECTTRTSQSCPQQGVGHSCRRQHH